MTVMNIVIALALVAIIVVFVIAFFVWKRENKLRTDSMWAIADSLDRTGLLQQQIQAQNAAQKPLESDALHMVQEFMQQAKQQAREPAPSEHLKAGQASQQAADVLQGTDFQPEASEMPKTQKMNEAVNSESYGEINLDFYDDIGYGHGDENESANNTGISGTIEDIEDITIEEYKLGSSLSGKNVGKSGKKYTADELEMLIKE